MVKYKIISRYGVTKYCIRSKKGQQLDEMAVQRLRTGEVPGLLSVDVDRRKTSFQLIYDVTGLTSLAVFLRQPVTKSVFIRLVRHIVRLFTVVPERHMECSKINFEMDSMFVNPASNELFFIYVPVGDCNNTVTLRELLLMLSSHCRFSPEEDNGYVSEFMQFISERTNISKLELGTLLDRLEGQMEMYQQPVHITCPHCGSLTGEDSVFCTNCGKPMVETPSEQQNIYDPFSGQGGTGQRGEMTGEGFMDWEGEDSASQEISEERTGGHGTTILGTSSGMYDRNESTVSLDHEDSSTSYLIRRRTGERIPVDGIPFRIGKDPSQCHYVVPDNRAVSRNHAELFYENGIYAIQDNASTNGTYVNGKRIESYQKTELERGNRLRLANEDFIFEIKEGEGQ